MPKEKKEKFIGTLSVEKAPVVLIDRKIILKFASKNPLEFSIWAYLKTIPEMEKFTIVSDNLIKDFKISKNKVEVSLYFLIEVGLISLYQNKEGEFFMTINDNFK